MIRNGLKVITAETYAHDFFILCTMVVLVSLLSFGLGIYTKSKIPNLTSDLDYILPDPIPRISVLIPVRNEEGKIQSKFMLSALRRNPVLPNRSTKAGVAIGYGPYMLVRSQAYKAVGGHQSIKSEVFDDHGLGRLFRSHGYRTLFAWGQEVFSVRPYSSLREFVEAYSRYFFPGFGRGKVHKAIFVMFFVLTLTFVPLAILIWALFTGGNLIAFCGVGQYLLATAAQAYGRKVATGFYGYFEFLSPLGAVMIAYVMARSTLFYSLGRPQYWKGRQHISFSNSSR